jgi:acylglycerol lipase
MPTFTAPDGTQLIYYPCEPPSPRAAILFLHGWSDHAQRWSGVGERFQSAGYAVYLLDQRGHGESGGRRGYLSRFSQLLGDLQAFRRAIRRRRPELPQVVLGHSFGGLVALRYLETQPSDALVAAVVASPWLALAAPLPAWKRLVSRVFADLWSTFPVPLGIDPAMLSRDPAVNAAWEGDRAVHRLMTPGAWREIQWAQRAVTADEGRIETALLLLLGGEDRIVDAHAARAFADALTAPVEVRWYPEMYHELLHDPQAERVVADVLTFLAGRGLA